MGIIRGARAGDAQCQLALGKLYLFGGASLPRSMPTALHWLNRAALQQQDEAWMLIGRYIPYEHARHCHSAVLPWYDRAYDAGVARAGLVLARLVLEQSPEQADAQLRSKALDALADAARTGCSEARTLLAQQSGTAPSSTLPSASAEGGALPAAKAGGGGDDSPYASLFRDWERAGLRAYLPQVMPLVRELLHGAPPDADAARTLGWSVLPAQLELLARCSAVLSSLPQHDAELHQCRELAAYGGDRHAQLALGLWLARMRSDGSRLPHGVASVNFKRAIRWLTLAAGQGLAEAWYALSRIYLKPEFSQRCVAEAQRHLERAAELGHCDAQLECGLHAWRSRRTEPEGDVRAAYWLQKAAAQGCDQAVHALARVASAPQPRAWAAEALRALAADAAASRPLLAARLELAAAFGLSRAEALLLDVKAADQGHCLVVDIRASYGRSKRRLILLGTARERQLLDRVQRRFDAAGGQEGWEGNYRQRLYRLKTCLAA
ncbi:hypothetical protein ACLB1G_09985 [Oxalobacteraceae bacterium A2-2]